VVGNWPIAKRGYDIVTDFLRRGEGYCDLRDITSVLRDGPRGLNRLVTATLGEFPCRVVAHLVPTTYPARY